MDVIGGKHHNSIAHAIAIDKPPKPTQAKINDQDLPLGKAIRQNLAYLKPLRDAIKQLTLNNSDMKIDSNQNSAWPTEEESREKRDKSTLSIEEMNDEVEKLCPEEQLIWANNKFGSGFALTTSFGIQSAVLLHMAQILNKKNSPNVIWVDTGYLPEETYKYADQLQDLLNFNLIVSQSSISPARMEALYGRLWESNLPEEYEKYHQIRKVTPLEETLKKLNVYCWASGVRKEQTVNRKSMRTIDYIRDRLSLRPLLNWSKKDIYYYMQKHNLPQHPLFKKGYSTVGDWHSSNADDQLISGRETRFGGKQQECGIHVTQESTNENEK